MLFNLVGIPLQLSCKKLEQNKKINIYKLFIMILCNFETNNCSEYNNIPDLKMTDSNFQALISLVKDEQERWWKYG